MDLPVQTLKDCVLWVLGHTSCMAAKVGGSFGRFLTGNLATGCAKGMSSCHATAS